MVQAYATLPFASLATARREQEQVARLVLGLVLGFGLTRIDT